MWIPAGHRAVRLLAEDLSGVAGGTWLDLSGRRCESLSRDGSAATAQPRRPTATTGRSLGSCEPLKHPRSIPRTHAG